MRYSFYPGCSMEGAAVPYHTSFKAIAKVLGIELDEIPDWNCCGATLASGVAGDYLAQILVARNLALAESMGQDILVPCSSCYMNLALVNRRFHEDPDFRVMANEALGVVGLRYNGTRRVRQIIEVLLRDVGLEKIQAVAKNPLKGLRVAGYVGCQTPRVFPWEFDDPEQPLSLDLIVQALGATPVDFPMKARCCGGSHSLTRPEITTDSGFSVIGNALQDNAQVIVTPCPMCQMNLDAYQSRIRKQNNLVASLPILFITQLMAVAFDLSAGEAALGYNIVSPLTVLKPFFETSF